MVFRCNISECGIKTNKFPLNLHRKVFKIIIFYIWSQIILRGNAHNNLIVQIVAMVSFKPRQYHIIWNRNNNSVKIIPHNSADISINEMVRSIHKSTIWCCKLVKFCNFNKSPHRIKQLGSTAKDKIIWGDKRHEIWRYDCIFSHVSGKCAQLKFWAELYNDFQMWVKLILNKKKHLELYPAF